MPVITDGAINAMEVLRDQIDNTHNGDMQSDDDQSADGEIGNKRNCDAIENFGAIEYPKEESNVNWIEEHDV